MDPTKNSELNLRNSFWSPDYITGIETFLEIVKNDNRCLSQELDFYRSLNLNCFTPFVDSLETVCNREYTLNDSHPLGRTVLSQFWIRLKNSGISTITETCITPLSTHLGQNKLYYNEIENELNEYYLAYKKTLHLVRESYTDCEVLVDNIMNNLTSFQKNKQLEQSDNISNPLETTTPVITTEDTRSSTNETLQFHNILYPFKLDDVLVFNNERELIEFLSVIKSQLIYQKTFISMLGLPNEYFKGSSLVKVLKKINPKLDTSLYNLIRVSQLLLSKHLIQEYNQIIGASCFNSIKVNFNIQRDITESSTFELDTYYIWNPSVFKNVTSLEVTTSKNPKSYDDFNKNTNVKSNPSVHNNISNSMSQWLRKINRTVTNINIGNSFLTQEELDKKIVQLQECQNKYFERYKRLLYTRLQLEKTFFIHCTRYAEYGFKTNQLIQLVAQNFQTFINNISGVPNNPSRGKTTITTRVGKQSYSHIGFFNRENSFTYTKWSINVDDTPSYAIFESMFSCTTITDDIINSISLIIKHIEEQIDSSKFDKEQILDYWGSNLDIIRATNLEREFLTEFQNMIVNSNVNTNTTRLLIEHNVNGSKFVLKDWIDLIKLFLLELPDSLIPVALTDEILKNEKFEWLNMIYTPKLRLIELIVTHLIKLGDVDLLFSLQNDIPFIQYFLRVRGISNDFEYAVTRLSNIVLDLFKNHMSELSSVIRAKLTKYTDLEDSIPTIKVDDENCDSNIDKPMNEPPFYSQKTISQEDVSYKHKRSVSMTLLSSDFKKLSFENKNSSEEEDFIPIPFKTNSTRSSPSISLNDEKRRSGISLLYASQDEKN